MTDEDWTAAGCPTAKATAGRVYAIAMAAAVCSTIATEAKKV